MGIFSKFLLQSLCKSKSGWVWSGFVYFILQMGEIGKRGVGVLFLSF